MLRLAFTAVLRQLCLDVGHGFFNIGNLLFRKSRGDNLVFVKEGNLVAAQFVYFVSKLVADDIARQQDSV